MKERQFWGLAFVLSSVECWRRLEKSRKKVLSKEKPRMKRRVGHSYFLKLMELTMSKF